MIKIIRIGMIIHHFQVEDNIAQAFCLVGEMQSAADHCKASIEVSISFKHKSSLASYHKYGFCNNAFL